VADLFWLSDEQWAVIEPFLPRNQPGPERKDDRRIISGILHVITAGCRWCDCPDTYGPSTTVYNRFNRWSRRGFWRAMLAALAKAGWAGDAAALDSTYVRAHRSAHGGNVWPAPSASGSGSAGLGSLHKRIRPSGEPLAKMEIRASWAS
jgi:transposase